MDNKFRIAVDLAIQAGMLILKKGNDGNVKKSIKADGSPITTADIAADKLIRNGLARTSLPIISEESVSGYVSGSEFWIVDPLDGTKEFLNGEDEFTVNIALIENNFPSFGVIVIPARYEIIYGGNKVNPVYGKINNNVTSQRLLSVPKKSKKLQKRAVISRSHYSEREEKFIYDNNIRKVVRVGSSLKLCQLALDKADVYPRYVGSSEWDIAAGHAILAAVGGNIFTMSTGKVLNYGKKNYRNPAFVAMNSNYSFQSFSY